MDTSIIPANGEKRTLITALQDYDPELAARAVAIMASRPADDKYKTITPDRAIAAALHERETGHREGRDFYIDQRMGIVSGYQGIQRDAGERNVGELITRYRPMNGAEAEEQEIRPGDMAVICEIYQVDAMGKARMLGIPYDPVIGYGILRKGEKFTKAGDKITLKGGYTWARKVRNRAYKDALRHTPGQLVDAGEVLEDAAAHGIRVEIPDGARISRDQALAAVEQAKTIAANSERLAEMTPEERATSAAHAVEEMRGPDSDDPFGIDAPTTTAPNCPKCNGPMWDNRQGKRNPKAPDFKCKDKSCDGVVWPPKGNDNETASGQALTAAMHADRPANAREILDRKAAAMHADAEFDALPSAPASNGGGKPPATSTAAAGIEGATQEFGAWAETFAANHPYYSTEDKTGAIHANKFHILKAIRAEGFDKVTADNFVAVTAAMEQRAISKEAEAAA